MNKTDNLIQMLGKCALLYVIFCFTFFIIRSII